MLTLGQAGSLNQAAEGKFHPRFAPALHSHPTDVSVFHLRLAPALGQSFELSLYPSGFVFLLS